MYEFGMRAYCRALAFECLCETRWTEAKSMRLANREIVIYSGHAEDTAPHRKQQSRSQNRSLFHQRYLCKDSNQIGKCYSSRCHAPTNDAEEESKNGFFARLQTVIADRKAKGSSQTREGQEWNGAHKPRWPTKEICWAFQKESGKLDCKTAS